MSYKKLALTLSLSASVFSINCQADSPPCTTGTIETTSGTVCGIEVEASNTGKTVDAFLGIPYAESTDGNNRWKPPIPKAPWQGTRRATQFGLFCPQPPLFPLLVRPSGEDCLSVNVWTPNDRPVDANLPVMVFIHGGAFLVGGSGIPLYDGSYISATENVVFVSYNYRLGALGFLVSPRLKGNYGFLDQQLALRWVQNNIKNWGGDPDKVTIFGHSAGAMSVGLHLASAPSSRNLFRAGIVHGNPYSLPYKTRKEAKDIGKLFTSLLDCHSYNKACLRKKSVKDILIAQSEVVSYFPTVWQGFGSIVTWTPVIDGRVLKNQPIEAQFIEKPTIIGTVLEEGMVFAASANPTADISATEYEELMQIFFQDKAPQVLNVYPPNPDYPLFTWMTLSQLITDYVFTCGSLHVAKNSAIGGYVDQFTQRSSFNLPLSYIMGMPFCGDSDRVCHGFELPYVFHTDDYCEVDYYGNNLCIEFTPEEEQFSQDMMHYWANFARHSNPNDLNNCGVIWPPFQSDNDYMDLNTSLTPQNAAGVCRFWDSIGYDFSDHFWPNLIDEMNANVKANK
jgi:carboxylesterase type B